MIPMLAAFPILALTAAQVPQATDSLRALAVHGSDSALVEAVRRSPMEARAAWRRLVATGAGQDSAAGAALTAAQRLAGAVAVAWQDSFLVRRLARFRLLSFADRQGQLSADSVFRAGNEARRTVGSDAAMGLFRESLRRYEAVADTSGMASAFNSIGAMFAYAQDNDSAEAYFTRSQQLAERIGNYETLANAIGNLGNMSLRRGDLRRASELYASAKPIRDRIGDARGLAREQGNLGVLAQYQGDLGAARRAYETSLAAARSSGETDAAGTALRNLATLDEWEGDYEQATARMREALATLRESGNQSQVAEAVFDLGRLAERRGDLPMAATTLLEAAGIMQRVGPGPTFNEIDVRVELASVRAAMGDLQGALAELRRAEMVGSRQHGTGIRARAVLAEARATLALRFNDLAEAERQYARAQRLAPGAGDPEMPFRLRVSQAAVLLRRGSYQRAQAALHQALREGPSVHSAASIRLVLGQAALRHGDTAAARRAFSQALDTLRALGVVPDEAEGLARLGDLEAVAGRALVAESLYQRGLARLGTRPAPAVAWQLHAGLAASLRHRSELADAAQELLAAIGEIERVSGGLRLEEHRSAFQADKWDLYVELALVERERGRTEAAFEASERLRARQMLDLLAHARITTPGAAGELVSREQDLRRQMAELTRQLEGATKGEPGMRDAAQPEAAARAASEALAHAQDVYAELLVQMRDADAAYAALVRGEIAPARAVMAALAPDEALLEYLVGDSTTIVFVVTAESLAAVDLKMSHDILAARVDFARTMLARPTDDSLRRAWRVPLRRLYRELFAPVEATGLLAAKRRLLIAPHAELHYLPFAALVGSGPPERLLVERYVLEYVPSASVWLRLRERPAPATGGGVLAVAPRPAALPGSRAEIAAIQRSYGERARTLVGPQATERAFRGLASAPEIVHLATFGVLNKHNPLFSYVELGRGGEEDGRLEVHEVFGLTLQARLVVLSACQTGVGTGALADVPPGDDWIGLVNGFLYAGAGNVLGTLWPVADVATARLMERFYGELAAGRSEAEALALAQRAALREPSTAHPFFWAGFGLVRGR